MKIAFGTDMGVGPHGDNAREFIYMVEAGMPAAFALQAATINAAQVLGVDDQGVIEAGSAPTSSPCRAIRSRTSRSCWAWTS